jgi:predicted permease
VWVPGATATVTGRGEPEEVRSLTASRSVLTTLGVPPAIGQWFSEADDSPGAPDTVILAGGYWQRRFGADPAVLDRTITINGRPHRVIGVMPAEFGFQDPFDIILPLRINPGAPIGAFRLVGVGRLRAGVTLAEANADAGRILRIWLMTGSRTDPEFLARYQPALVSLKQDVVGDVGRTLWVLMAAIGVVLLMACANVANLLLVRADGRRREFAIRVALGARWGRVARQLVVESVVLAACGGIVGVGLAFGALKTLVALEPSNLPRLDEISIDGVALVFALAAALLSALLFGLMPIVKYARPQLAETLTSGGRDSGFNRERQRSQQLLVIAQMTLALMLLVGAGLMIRSVQSLRQLDPGFADPGHVQTFSVGIPRSVAPEPERVTRMQQELLNTLTAIPGVTSAAFTTRVPMGSDRSSTALTVEGRADDGRTPPNRHLTIVSPGMFQTMVTPLVAGRDFTWTDLHELREVAMVSENLAREFWGSPAAALGKRVREYYNPKSPWREIVGVVGDVYDDGADQRAPTTIYWPAQPIPVLVNAYQSRRATFAIRTDRAGSEGLLADIRESVWSINRDLPLAEVRTLDEVFGRSMARTSFTLTLLAIAGAMASLLGISGLYGVVAYAVSQRRREIGIRMALGARGPDIRRLFMRRGLMLVACGLVIGLAGAATLTRLMQSLLFGVGPRDPVTFVVMPCVLAIAALLATYLPARRAVAVDPVETMRAE